MRILPPFSRREPREVAPGIRTFVTFRDLGGASPSAEALYSEIRRWPLDAWLGFLGRLTIEMFQAGYDAMDPRFQGNYLNRAIVDDFPQHLRAAPHIYAPGRVPITGEKHMLVHEQNIAWLAHAALMVAPEGSTTNRLSEAFITRASRMLLLVNDVLGKDHVSTPLRDSSSLSTKRTVAIDLLRNFQFNRFIGGEIEALARLARQRTIFLDVLQKHFDIRSCFAEASGGLDLERHFQVLALVIVHWAHQLAPGKHWIRKDTFSEALRSSREEFDQIAFGRWTATPAEYRQRSQELARPKTSELSQPHFDFVALREKPLIEARPGEVICPAVPFLLSKIEDDLFFMISKHLSEDPARRQQFQALLGAAYEQYAGDLLDEIRKLDKGGAWQIRRSPGADEGAELCDTYLQRGDVALCVEHKLGRPGTEFLTGGVGGRVLGPATDILEKLDQRKPITYEAGRDADDGYLTKGMWQLSSHGPALQEWARSAFGTTPKLRFPLLTHLFGPTIEVVSRNIYIKPLIRAAGLLPGEDWAAPQWLDADVLESLLALAERGSLDLEALLRRKTDESCDERFDIFINNLHGDLLSERSRKAAIALLESAEAQFFPGSGRLREPTP